MAKSVKVGGRKLSEFSDIVKQIDQDLHPDLIPSKTAAGSGKRVNWKCPDCNHKWNTKIADRTIYQTGCPECSYSERADERAKVDEKESIQALYPDFSAMWYQDKNSAVKPNQVSPSSNREYWWKCPVADDHIWKAPPYSLLRSYKKYNTIGCPFCSGKKTSITNSLKEQYPEVAQLWHPTKNEQIRPEDIVSGSKTKRWWKCPAGDDHEWYSAPGTIIGNNKRSKSGNGCPFCDNHKLSYTNCLSTVSPELAKEWNSERNKKGADQVIAGGHTKYWWKCDNGHEWEASVKKRVSGRGCPECHILPRSRIEILLGFELSNFFNIDFGDHKLKIKNKIWDVDVKILEPKLIIEYDGAYWHKNKIDTDKKKTEDMIEDGWKVIRIREQPLPMITEDDIQIPIQYHFKDDDIKTMTDTLLKQIEKVCCIKIDKLEEYIKRKSPVNTKSATQYISQLLKDKNQTTLM